MNNHFSWKNADSSLAPFKGFFFEAKRDAVPSSFPVEPLVPFLLFVFGVCPARLTPPAAEFSAEPADVDTTMFLSPSLEYMYLSNTDDAVFQSCKSFFGTASRERSRSCFFFSVLFQATKHRRDEASTHRLRSLSPSLSRSRMCRPVPSHALPRSSTLVGFPPAGVTAPCSPLPQGRSTSSNEGSNRWAGRQKCPVCPCPVRLACPTRCCRGPPPPLPPRPRLRLRPQPPSARPAEWDLRLSHADVCVCVCERERERERENACSLVLCFEAFCGVSAVGSVSQSSRLHIGGQTARRVRGAGVPFVVAGV